MHKLSKQKRAWLKLRSSKLVQRKVRKGSNSRSKPKDKKQEKWWDRSLDAPEEFDLLDRHWRAELIGFIREMFKAENKNEKLRLSFQNTKKIQVDALLVFIARLEQAVGLSETFSLIKIAPSKLNPINAVLTQTGALEICGQDFHINPQEDEAVVHWRKLQGNTTDKFDPRLIYRFLGETGGQKVSRVLFSAVKEALTNIKHHAYEGRKPGGWWIFIRTREDAHTVVVCDLGMGIPVSIEYGVEKHQKVVWEKIKKGVIEALGRPALDSEMIEESMEYGKSRTQEENRGKGLPKMKQVTELVTSARVVLRIDSNKGCYTKHSMLPKPSLSDYETSIGGTVVTWTIPLNVDEMIEA